TGFTMGTLHYMAPERERGQGDHRSDIFSVGAVLYELLTYRPPFAGNDPLEILEQLRSQDPPSVTETDPTLPIELAAIVERALRKDPTQRFATLAEMRTKLLLMRRRLTENTERIREEVQTGLRQLQEVREALATRVGIGGPAADESDQAVLVV